MLPVGFTAQLLKGVFKCMTLSLGQYVYPQSRHAADLFVQAAAKRFPDSVVKFFIDASKDVCEKDALIR